MKRGIYILAISLLFVCLSNTCIIASCPSEPLLRVAQNNRYLEYSTGGQFYYIADTAWELFHRCSREEVEEYFVDRASKGFTVVQAVALAELDGLNTPNFYGERALLGNDPLLPNEAYWEHVDWVIKCAAKHGLIIALLPTWGDKVDLQWGVGPVIFDCDNSYQYGQWIARRYFEQPNIIWVVGGDRDCNKGNEDVWRAMAAGIKNVDKEHLMTFHPRGGTSSSLEFHADDWLDFNMLQSGHWARYIDNHAMVSCDYNLSPTKPCIDGEPNYEDHAINWKREFGWFNDDDIRRANYWAIFAGAMGAVYGAHPVWQMKHESHEPIGDVRRNWDEALSLKGASQMGHLHSLMRECEFNRLSVDTVTLAAQLRKGLDRQLTMRGEEICVLYQTVGCYAELNLEWMTADVLRLRWYNPRTGDFVSDEQIEYQKRISVIAPVVGIDWILIIESKNNQDLNNNETN